jgi:hypothetical protein
MFTSSFILAEVPCVVDGMHVLGFYFILFFGDAVNRTQGFAHAGPALCHSTTELHCQPMFSEFLNSCRSSPKQDSLEDGAPSPGDWHLGHVSLCCVITPALGPLCV